MISLTLEREEFAARRRKVQDELVVRLQGVIGATFGQGDIENLDKAVERMFTEIYTAETDQPMRRTPLNRLRTTIRRTLGRATDESSVHVTALMVASAIINAATEAAADAEGDGLVLEWVTMHDGDVRPAHAETDGQRRPPGEDFDVAGVEMPYPGWPGAPVELWINCRCVLQPSRGAVSAASFPRNATADGGPGPATTQVLNGLSETYQQQLVETYANTRLGRSEGGIAYSDSQQTQGATMTVTETETPVEEVEDEIPEVPGEEAEAPVEDVTGVPWHGVLAPEDVMSGDKRRFTNLGRTRDLPLPLTWQEMSAEGHDQSIVVAKIEKTQMIDGLMHASGHFLSTVEEADKVIGLIAEFGKFGVSVDADDVGELTFNEEDESATFDDPRVCSAAIVPIPAFMEAWVALGEHPILDAENEEVAASVSYIAASREFRDAAGQAISNVKEGARLLDEGLGFRDVPQDERDRRADDGTAMPDGSYPIGNCEDLRNAIQAIGRAKDPEATKRHIKKRKSALGCEDVELPEGWATEDLTEMWADIEQFADLAPGVTEDGPGWLTHPVDTDRLRDYWVRGPGAAKIGWGTPGDFNRCRMNVAEYVKPQYLSGYCANRHFDALGFWPGEHSAAKDTLELTAETAMAPALTIRAAGGFVAPSEWFKDPEFTEPTRLTITDEGEVYAHIAQWGVCHIGLNGKCTNAPPSETDYAFFAEGKIDLDDGTVARVGQLTVDIPHADDKSRLRIAAAHYDDTKAVWADVAVGEDAHGIWVHGWVRPGTDPAKVHAAKASGRLSGDWRWCEHSQSMELVAALSVNVEGFQVKPTVGLVAGAQVSLIAAGMVQPKTDESTANIKTIAAAVADELEAREERKQKMASLREQYAGEKEE